MGQSLSHCCNAFSLQMQPLFWDSYFCAEFSSNAPAWKIQVIMMTLFSWFMCV